MIIHAWYPHMLWEVWMRIAMQLYEYYSKGILAKDVIFALMLLDSHDFSFHDWMLGPFTNYPLLSVQTLIENTSGAFVDGINAKNGRSGKTMQNLEVFFVFC